MSKALPPERMLTPPQVAAQLAVHTEKVLRWIRSGKLRAINVTEKPFGRPRYRVKPADLEAFVASLTVIPEAGPASRHKETLPPGFIEYF